LATGLAQDRLKATGESGTIGANGNKMVSGGKIKAVLGGRFSSGHGRFVDRDRQRCGIVPSPAHFHVSGIPETSK